MNSKRFLIKIQFLGFRYHGVQKQTAHQSIQGRVETALAGTFGESSFKTRFASRTDAMVSAVETYFLLMFDSLTELSKIEESLKKLPQDIKIQEIKAVDDHFSMLKSVVEKEYHYFFSFGKDQHHPFAAPFITHLHESLDVDEMKKGANLFIGTHNFINYAYKPKPDSYFERTVFSCEIVENDFFTASFFPEKSFVLKIRAHGFMRGQVRLIAGSLFRLGMGEILIADLEHSLVFEDSRFVKWMAPAAGLILHKTILK